jgi:hypothetical protein
MPTAAKPIAPATAGKSCRTLRCHSRPMIKPPCLAPTLSASTWSSIRSTAFCDYARRPKGKPVPGVAGGDTTGCARCDRIPTPPPRSPLSWPVRLLAIQGVVDEAEVDGELSVPVVRFGSGPNSSKQSPLGTPFKSRLLDWNSRAGRRHR